MIRSSTHGLNIQSGMIRSGCGYTLQDILNDGTAGDALPDVPENSFREWRRVTEPDAPDQAWDIRDWQHQGYQRILSRIESFTTRDPHDQTLGRVRNSDAVPVQLRRHSPMPLRFLKVIARLLRKSLQSSMATLAMLNVVIFRSRLLSGSGRCLAPLAVEDFLVNDRQLSVSI